MSRPVRLLIAVVAALVLAALPATAGAATHRSSHARAHARVRAAKVAGRSFAPFRRAARPSDRVPAALGSVSRATARRWRGGVSRRIASGPDFAVYLVVGVGGSASRHGFDPRAEVIYVRRDHGRAVAIGGRTVGRLARLARDGGLVSDTLPSGMVRTVVVVPDGTHGAHQTGATGGARLGEVANAIVVLAAGGELDAVGSDGRDLGWPLPIAHLRGTPISVLLLPGSQAHLDLGNGRATDVRLAGQATGTIPGGFLLSSENRVILSTLDLALGSADPSFAGTGCAARALPVVGADMFESFVTLDPARDATVTISATGAVTVDAPVLVHMVMDLRGADGCITGFSQSADAPAHIVLRGQVDLANGALTRVALTSDPTPVTLEACPVAGQPTDPCGQAPQSVPATVTASVFVAVKIGA